MVVIRTKPVSSLVSAAHNAVEDNFTDYLANLLNVREDSFLAEFDELNVEAKLKNAIESSVAYMLLTRCGIDASKHYNFENFKFISSFNTPETVAILGDATSDIAEMALREIGETIKNLQRNEKNKIRTFAEKDQIEYHNTTNNTNGRMSEHDEFNLYNAGRLSSSRPDTFTGTTNREIWNVAQNIPQKPQERDLRRDDDFRQTNEPSIRDRQDSNAADRADNVADGESTGRNGAAQSNRSDEMGWNDEQHQALSGGNSAQRADLQLEYFCRETEDKSLPFFHSDKYINDILKTTPHLNATKQEITNFYATHLDDEEREKYIKGIFNNDYTEITIDGDHRVGYKTYQNVLHLWEGSYNSRISQGYYDWAVIANHFEGMILLNELIDIMKPLPSIGQQIFIMDKAEVANRIVEITSAFAFSQEIIDYDLQRGSGIADGKYRIYEQFEKNQPANENEKFLINEYGWGGASPIKSGTGIGEEHSAKGITLSRGETKLALSWSKVAKRIGELIEANRYFSAKEKEYFPIYLQNQDKHKQQIIEEKIARDVLSRTPTESQRYSLEDQIIKYFPQQIKSTVERIKGYKSDMVKLLENTKPNEDKFSPMVVGGITYTEKAEAGKAILEACKNMTSPDPKTFGEYRGFTMELSFDSFSREYKISIKNELSHSVALGSDVHGNITRLDNALEGFGIKLQACEELLSNTKTQMENAKVEMERPFIQEDELKTKSARLDELNILLNMDQKDNELVDGEPDEVADVPAPKSKEYER